MSNYLPDPEQTTINAWLHDVTPDYLHSAGWIAVNARFHGLAMAARHFAQQYPPEQRAAFFDGLTLGLAALLHVADLEEIRSLFEAPDVAA